MKNENRCAIQCHCQTNNRRAFIKNSAFFAAGTTLLGEMSFGLNNDGAEVPVINSGGGEGGCHIDGLPGSIGK